MGSSDKGSDSSSSPSESPPNSNNSSSSSDNSQQYNGQQQYSSQHAPWHTSPGQHQDSNNYATGPTGMSSAQWGGGGGQAMMPPPPMMSADMSSANYSSGPTGPALPPPHPSVALGFSKSTFTYDELAAATNGFSKERLLGQGGFGYVHKGLLPNGKEIAVKSLKSGSGQGEREFQAEVEIISRVHHRHLVSLVGYCIAGGQRMLVYEFVPNNTLEFHLHGKGRPVMDFNTRMKIALGSAKGLAYLHEDCHPRIIHRDIKTANILIDNCFEAKVADFGLAKLSSDTFTHVSTRVMGTFGYLAPEYASSGKLTEKSDVFSFGVMLLELITGRRPIDPSSEEEDSLVDWTRPLIARAMDEGNFSGLVDPRLEGEFDSEEMMRLIACAGASIRHSGKRRPKMSQIVRALEGDVSLDDLNEGAKVRNGSTLVGSSGGSSDYDTVSYNNDMKKFRRTALNSTDYPSSEYGATNEYGHTSGSSAEMSPSMPKRTSPSPNHFV
uniref:non-specific serine/threonine protein kinase n=1 Tax=Chenopodium quinoa TaxID=63459 RepID=A0A803LDS7_CHEQI